MATQIQPRPMFAAAAFASSRFVAPMLVDAVLHVYRVTFHDAEHQELGLDAESVRVSAPHAERAPGVSVVSDAVIEPLFDPETAHPETAVLAVLRIAFNAALHQMRKECEGTTLRYIKLSDTEHRFEGQLHGLFRRITLCLVHEVRDHRAAGTVHRYSATHIRVEDHATDRYEVL